VSFAADPALTLTVHTGLALLLGRAALHKLRDLPAFRTSLAAYALLPAWSVAAMSLAFPVTETLLAAMLLHPATAPVAALGAALLLALYAAAVAINLGRGRASLDCGCAGPQHRQPISYALVWRNLGIAAIALASMLPVRPRALIWIDLGTVAAAVGVSALLYLSIDLLLAQAHGPWRRIAGAVDA